MPILRELWSSSLVVTYRPLVKSTISFFPFLKLWPWRGTQAQSDEGSWDGTRGYPNGGGTCVFFCSLDSISVTFLNANKKIPKAPSCSLKGSQFCRKDRRINRGYSQHRLVGAVVWNPETSHLGSTGIQHPFTLMSFSSWRLQGLENYKLHFPASFATRVLYIP